MWKGAGSNSPDDLDKRILGFIKDLLNPEQFGYSVTEEVRTEARKILVLLKERDKSAK